MGSGKSIVGKLLSKKLNMPLLDIDKEIEKIMEMSISQIFNDYGEKRFRLIEAAFFRECTKLDYYIFATGGGIILNEQNRSILKSRGITFFLDCSPEIINKRLKNKINNRPLLFKSYERDLQSLFDKRYNLYKSNSKYTINTDLLSVKDITQKIKEYLNV